MKPQHSAKKRGKPMKSELVMILVAMASALVLMGMLIACIPYYDTGTREIADPEPLLQQQREQEQEEPPEEPPTEETQMPTVPPEKNPYNRRDFQFSSHNYLLCTQQDSYPGIDVSSFQGLIDWQKVKASGIRFAMIRLGYRGYGQAGNMVEDDYARRNLEEARKAGLEIGAYFFSQATTVDEVDDEIFFFMKILGDTELTMPIVLDWERVGVETARTNNVDAETLTALYGHHHGESDAMQEKGLAIVQYMRRYLDARSERTHMNYSLLATPAEGLSGRFVRMDKKRYGLIPGVTDKDYYTNSFHIPVYYNISAYEKIRKEAPYHALTNAGHISYVELDGDTANNLEAFESIVRCMHDCGIGYGSINHPVDRDPICGYVGVIGEVCPRCGRREGEAVSPERIKELRKLYPGTFTYCGCE